MIKINRIPLAVAFFLTINSLLAQPINWEKLSCLKFEEICINNLCMNSSIQTMINIFGESDSVYINKYEDEVYGITKKEKYYIYRQSFFGDYTGNDQYINDFIVYDKNFVFSIGNISIGDSLNINGKDKFSDFFPASYEEMIKQKEVNNTRRLIIKIDFGKKPVGEIYGLVFNFTDNKLVMYELMYMP